MQLAQTMPRLQDRYRHLWPAVYWLVTAIGAVWCFLIVFGVVPYGTCGNTGTVPCDSYSYWAVDSTPYTWETNLEYRYSPAFLWIIGPLQALSFEVFLAIWTGLHIVALVWLRAGWFLIVPGLNEDVLRGNISTFIAVAAVLAIQRSAAWWAPVLLTKITPGVGLVWHAVRRDWRGVGICLLVTGAIVAVGFLVSPDPWRDWFDSVLNAPQTYEVGHPLGPVWLRVLIAAGIIGFAARTDRAWLVPLGLYVAVPGLWWFNLGLFAAVPLLLRYRAARPDPA
jgi:Glycosyltransferase family 87